MSGAPRNGARLDAEALVQAGLEHQRAGRLGDAEKCCQAALTQAPEHAGASHLLGLLRIAQRRTGDGIVLLRRAAAAAPNLPAVWYNLGLALRAQQHDGEAVSCLTRAVALNPNYAEAHLALGTALQATGRPDEAFESFRHLRDCQPQDPSRLLSLGMLFGDAGGLEDAAECFRRVTELEPGIPDAHSNLGTALQRLGRPAEAADSFRRALALTPEDADAHFRLGVALGDQNLLDQAIACYRAALALRPDHHKSRFNMALLLLRGGNFAEGFSEYECRWQSGVLTPSPHAARPPWRGEAVPAGTTILLHAEQGFGDTLQCFRYAPLVAALGANVVVEVQPQLKPLFPGAFARGETLPPFDLQCPMMSLPFALATQLEKTPAPLPLAAPADRRASWALPHEPGMRRIGIAWSGNADHPNDRARSVPLAEFRRILDAPGCAFYLLQPELRAADETLFKQLAVVDCRGSIEDFADTAAIIEGMDLVITADTAVAHLAAAMQKPVWVLLPYAPDWRWLLGRDDSPWYPTVRLFRQDRPGDWSGVIDRVRSLRSER